MSEGTTLPNKAESITSNVQHKLSKKERQRLKKLRKRVSQVQKEGERSGLLTSNEWTDYQRLETTPDLVNPVGPSVHIRTGKEESKVEGVHHRDLLAWFLKQIIFPCTNSTSKEKSKKSKKRSRSERDDPVQSSSLPSWASIHNPGALRNIAVLEVHVPEDFSSYSSIIESHFEACQRGQVSLPTKWFQGSTPRPVSDSLLYFAAEKVKNTKDAVGPVPTRDQLLVRLQSMTVSSENLEKENYPSSHEESTTSVLKSKTDDISRMATIQTPNSIDLETAKELVEKYGILLDSPKKESEQMYACTQASEEAQGKPPRVLGLDCEMVRTSLGMELARLTLVEFEDFCDGMLCSRNLLDVLVKPEATVLDYLTIHSGITANLLEPISTRLVQVQAALVRFLRPNDILVGHSLENDLHAAQYIHPNVIDTALIFRHRNKRTKFSLKHLAAILLKKKIQAGSHCSEEDAEASLELAVRRAWHGPSFGVAAGDERRSIFEGLNSKAKVVCMGPAPWLKSHVTSFSNGIHALGYESIPECKKAMLAMLKGRRKADLTWARLTIDSRNKAKDVDSFKELLVSLSALQWKKPRAQF